MTGDARERLWRQLSDAGVAHGDPPAASPPPAPWYVRAMLGIAGWIGALFLLGFVGAGLAFVFRSGAASLLAGALCCAGAFLIFKAARRNDLASQFGLAVSLAGQVMVIYGLHESLGFDSSSPVFFIEVMAFEAVLAFFIANFVHRVMSSLAAAVALSYALHRFGLIGTSGPALAALFAALWLDEPKWAPRGDLWRPAGYGLAFALVVPDFTYFAIERVTPVFGPTWIIWIRGLLFAAVLIFAVYRLLERYGVPLSGKTGFVSLVASAAVSLATLRAPGVVSALIILLVGFSGSSRTLLGLGVAGLLGYLSYFYYSLQATLLVKSLVLMATGAVLIVAWVVMRALFGDAPAEEAAHA